MRSWAGPPWSIPIDQTITRSLELQQDVYCVNDANLIRAPIGTAVMMYDGFGGIMPSQYRRVHRQDVRGVGLVLLGENWPYSYSRTPPAEATTVRTGGQSEINP